MNDIRKVIFFLLDKLKKINSENDYDGLLAQKVLPPEPFDRGIPTLSNGVYKLASPMIKCRFEYAASWENAGISHKWLSTEEMEKARSEKKIQEQIEIKKNNWQNSIVAKHSFDEITLFGIDAEEFEETYLLWNGDEPKIYLYSGHDELIFENFKEYLVFLTET